MPVIQPSREQQRITPSSPVPIGASEQARVGGDMGARLGNAIFDLGNTLARVGKEKEDKNARMEAGIAADKVKRKMQRDITDAKQNMVVNKPSDLIDSVEKGADEFSAQVAGELSSDLARQYFKSAVSNVYTEMAPTSLATGEAMSRARSNDLFNQKAAGYNEDMADLFSRTDVDGRTKAQKLSIQLLQVEADVSDPANGIPTSMVGPETRKLQSNMVKSVVDRMKQDGNYNAARSILRNYQNLFETDTHDKEIAAIETAQYNSLNKTQLLIKQKTYFAEQEVEQVRQQQFDTLREMLSIAKNPSERNYVIGLMNKSDLTQAQISSLTSTDKEMTKRQDDPTVSMFMNRIIEQGATAAIRKDLNTLRTMKGSPLSEDGYQEIVRFYNSMRSDQNRDRRLILGNYTRLIDAWEKNTMTAVGEAEFAREHAVRVRQVRARFGKAFVANPGADVGALFESIVVPQLPGLGRSFDPSRSTGENLTLGADPEIKAAAQEMVKARTSGDRAAIERANNRMKEIQKRKGLLK